MAEVKAKNPGELEFHEAVKEVVTSVALVVDRQPRYRNAVEGARSSHNPIR